jgi:pyrrolidone-carboxylate peptidase
VRGEAFTQLVGKRAAFGQKTKEPTWKKCKQIQNTLLHQAAMEGARFWPPLYSQRHRAVATFLASHDVSSLLDFGCGEGTNQIKSIAMKDETIC